MRQTLATNLATKRDRILAILSILSILLILSNRLVEAG